MFVVNDFPSEFRDTCLEYIDDVTNDEIWSEVVDNGVDASVIPNFSNIYLKLLAERVEDVVRDNGYYVDVTINNMASSIDILKDDNV
jgi:uncharacterized protein (DUF924 family)